MDLNNLINFLDDHTIKSIPLTIFTDFIGEKKCNQLKKLTNNYKNENQKGIKSNVKAWCSSYHTHKLTDKFGEYEKIFTEHCEKIYNNSFSKSNEFFMSEFWIAKYDEGDYTVSHNHGSQIQGNTISGIYYIDIEENASPVIFEGYEPVVPQNDMLVIFASKIYHHVPRTKGGRLLVSFNLGTNINN